MNDRGELVAIPINSDVMSVVKLIYIREDWLENLGLELPTTFDELEEVARQFTFNDPDQDGKDNTYGFAFNKYLSDAFGGMNGVVYAYNSYPNEWIKDDDGNLVNGDILPETRNALIKLQEMYAEGLINKEYVAMDNSAMLEDIVSDKVGIVFGEWWAPCLAT